MKIHEDDAGIFHDSRDNNCEYILLDWADVALQHNYGRIDNTNNWYIFSSRKVEL